MVGIAKEVTDLVVEVLRGPGDLAEFLADEGLERGVPVDLADRVVGWQVGGDVAERNLQIRYPHVAVYCGGMKNQLKEKFRRVSGSLEMVAEVRVSADRADGLQETLQNTVAGVTKALEDTRGDWGEGLFYSGQYEVAFGAVKFAGKGFGQMAKVTFAMEVSRG